MYAFVLVDYNIRYFITTTSSFSHSNPYESRSGPILYFCTFVSKTITFHTSPADYHLTISQGYIPHHHQDHFSYHTLDFKTTCQGYVSCQNIASGKTSRHFKVGKVRTSLFIYYLNSTGSVPLIPTYELVIPILMIKYDS